MRNLIQIFLLFGGVTLCSFSTLLAQSLTFTVNSRIDAPDMAPGDGICSDLNGNCTFRAAIQESNANVGFHDFIFFNIPGAGVQTIIPSTPLPPLVDNAGATIDGTTQPGASGGNNPPATAILLIELKGNAPMLAPVHGLWVLSDNNNISGLVINEFSGDGIRIEGTPESTDNNFIFSNFIGTDPSGTFDQGNARASNPNMWWAGVNLIVPPCDGAPVFVFNNFVHHNLISGNGAFPIPVNRGEGVSISSCPPGDNALNIIDFNYIGTDITGTLPLGNDSDGVTIAEAAHDNVIGDNLISGNGFSGVGINGLNEPPRFTIHNHVVHNIIGLDITRSYPIPNMFQGVSIGMYGPNTWGYAPDNNVVDNTISFNMGNGVLVAEFFPPGTNCDGNMISQNSIYANGALGIDLVSNMGLTGMVTFNDPIPDADFGPNEECNFPVILSAIIGAGTTTITGTVDFPNPFLGIVEIFEAMPDPSGYGEGMNWLGTSLPDAAGNWTLTTPAPLTINSILTATSIDMFRNTSEFSANFANIVTETATVDNLEFRIFPNPTSGKINVVLGEEQSGKVTIEIINTSGVVLKVYELKKSNYPETLEIDLSNYASGFYWIRVNGEKISVVKKLVLAR